MTLTLKDKLLQALPLKWGRVGVRIFEGKFFMADRVPGPTERPQPKTLHPKTPSSRHRLDPQGNPDFTG